MIFLLITDIGGQLYIKTTDFDWKDKLEKALSRTLDVVMKK